MRLQQTAVPTPPPPPSPTGVVPTIDGVPQTFGDVRGLRAQRSELSNQLSSAQGRRDDVVEQLAEASSAERPGLEARLKLLDERILEIEGEIARTGELIAQTPGNLLSTSSQAPRLGGGALNNVDFTAVFVVLIIFVLAPLAVTASRFLWKRASNPAPKRVDTQAEDRMRRLESGIDAIAIEVERISEGQRFVTKLLSEREKQPVLRRDN